MHWHGVHTEFNKIFQMVQLYQETCSFDQPFLMQESRIIREELDYI
jgi:hypothetical protein